MDIHRSVIMDEYAEFTGRARRAEFWWFAAIDTGVILGLLI